MRRVVQLTLLATLAIASTGAEACRVTPTQDHIDAVQFARFVAADAAVEVEALTGPDQTGRVRFRVLRNYGGPFEVGAVVEARMGNFVCGCVCYGPREIPVQGRGLVLLTRENDELLYDGPLNEGEITLLRRAGALPPEGAR